MEGMLRKPFAGRYLQLGESFTSTMIMIYQSRAAPILRLKKMLLRFKAYGWQVLGPLDGNDIQAINNAIRDAQVRHVSQHVCKTLSVWKPQ